MLNQRINQHFSDIVILNETILKQLPFNYIDIFISNDNKIHIVCSIINQQLTIYMKSIETSIENFYYNLFNKIYSNEVQKTFFLLKNDELTLSKIYKEVKLNKIKEWFLSISKIVDSTNELQKDQNIEEVILFELKIYNQSDDKQSKNFYFIDLLLQRLESRIEFSKQLKEFNPSKIDELLLETDYKLFFSHTFSASQQSFSSNSFLNKQLANKLKMKGINNLYTYQVEVASNILEEKSVVITAPTGNGKTESFLLPVLQKIQSWKTSGQVGIKVILFYPTKALASDQLAKINFFTKDTGISVIQIDSDVDKYTRNAIYADSRYDLLITTPDLIHYSLHKKLFANFITNTKIIVFDEVHAYNGTFGTHLYFFLRRLERVLKKGRNIQYIASSATIANPVEFTTKLFQKQMVHIDCKTPKKNRSDLYCIRRRETTSKYDALFQLVNMLTQTLVDEKIIVFRNSQQECEKTFEKLRFIKNKHIALHRAGLTKESRVLIENKLRENRIDVVITTTTLEVGIDIGGITTIITPIVPVNRLLQRIGRAGRGNAPAKIFLELKHDPISYYYSTHADAYLKDISSVNITTENELIASLHRTLLPYERKEITKNDEKIFGSNIEDQNEINLFSLRNINEVIEVKTEKGYRVTEKELPNAFYEFYPFAQILHNSKVYKVKTIERDVHGKMTAIVVPQKEQFDYNYKIRPLIEKKVFTNAVSKSIDYIGPVEVKLSECRIELKYLGNKTNYKESVLLDSYTYEFASKCVIFNFEDLMGKFINIERSNGVEIGSIVHTLSHVLFKATKMIIYCDNDLINMENSIGKWKIIFVDNTINGNGMSELLYSKKDEIWIRAIEILNDCNCENKNGCVKCTMDYSCNQKNRGLIKIVLDFFLVKKIDFLLNL